MRYYFAVFIYLLCHQFDNFNYINLRIFSALKVVLSLLYALNHTMISIFISTEPKGANWASTVMMIRSLGPGIMNWYVVIQTFKNSIYICVCKMWDVRSMYNHSISQNIGLNNYVLIYHAYHDCNYQIVCIAAFCYWCKSYEKAFV